MENKDSGFGFDKFMDEIVENEAIKVRRAENVPQEQETDARILQRRHREMYLNRIKFGKK